MCCIIFSAQISSLTNAADREAQRHAAEIETERRRRQSELDEVSARVRAIVAKKDAQVWNAPASNVYTFVILLTGREARDSRAAMNKESERHADHRLENISGVK